MAQIFVIIIIQMVHIFCHEFLYAFAKSGNIVLTLALALSYESLDLFLIEEIPQYMIGLICVTVTFVTVFAIYSRDDDERNKIISRNTPLIVDIICTVLYIFYYKIIKAERKMAKIKIRSIPIIEGYNEES